MNNLEQIITWMDWATIIFAFFAMITSGYNLWKNSKQLTKIPIYFNENKLNLDITRKNFSRSEIQGILGILRVDMKTNYHIEYLSTIEFLDNIYKIQTNMIDKLEIKITQKELEQFKDDIYETINNY